MPNLVAYGSFGNVVSGQIAVPAGMQQVLLVKIGEWVRNNDTPILVTLAGGTLFGLMAQAQAHNKGGASIWGLSNPPVGAQGVTIHGKDGDIAWAWEVWSGVDHYGDVMKDTNSNTTPSLTVPGAASVITDCLATVFNDVSVTPGQGQTKIVDQVGGNARLCVSTAPGPATVGWTITGGENQRAYIALPLFGSSAPTPPPPPDLTLEARVAALEADATKLKATLHDLSSTLKDWS